MIFPHHDACPSPFLLDTSLRARLMANTVLATLTGEANPNGKPKTKSKNQLRRLKQKQKKVNGTTVSFQYIVDNFKHLMRKHFY